MPTIYPPKIFCGPCPGSSVSIQKIGGPQGPQGPQGPRGPTGCCGQTGGTNTEIQIYPGNTGTIKDWQGNKIILVKCNTNLISSDFQTNLVFDIYPPADPNSSILTFRLLYKKGNTYFIRTHEPLGTTYLDSAASERSFIYQDKKWLQINDIEYTNYFPTTLLNNFENPEPNNTNNNFFGNRVSVNEDGTILAAGAPGIKDTSGVVYIYTRNNTTFNWNYHSKVTEAGTLNFGWCVALSGNGKVLVVGEVNTQYDQVLNTTPRKGGVWIYWWNEGSSMFVLKQKIPDTNPLSSFGYALAVNCNGTGILVGAPWDSYESINAVGSAIFYYYDMDQDLYAIGDKVVLDTASDAGITGMTRMGFAVCMSADTNTIALGGPSYYNAPYEAAGAFWVFERNNKNRMSYSYYLKQKITIDASLAYLGCSMSMSADACTIASGAANYSPQGICLVYSRTASSAVNDSYAIPYIKDFWTLTGDLQPAPNFANVMEKLGWCCSMSGDGKTIAVGGFGNPSNPNTAGIIMVYTKSSTLWTYREISNNNYVDRFGESVSLSADGNTLVVGRIKQNSDKGGIYVYS